MSNVESQTSKISLSSWIASAFAIPTALLILSKFDKRLDFSSFLERIVLNFENFSKGIWGIFTKISGIDFTSIHGLMSIFCLYYIAVAKDFFVGQVDRELNKRVLNFELLCQSLFLVLAISNFNYHVFFLPFVIILFIYLSYHSEKAIKLNLRRPTGFEVFISPLLLGLLGLSFTMIENNQSPEIVVVLMLGGLASYHNALTKFKSVYFSRVILFVTGVYIIDFVVNRFKPWLDQFLTSIGV